MANPAALLFENLRQWNPPNISTQTAPKKIRNLASNRDHALRMHEIAMGYIAQIRELLDTLEQTTGIEVDEYRREIPNWTAMVLSYSNGWVTAEVFNDTSMRILKLLIPLLDGLVPKFSDDDIDQVAEGLKELLAILGKETTISRELSVYILNLVNHVSWVVRDAKIQGDFQLARAVTLLRDSLGTAADVTTDPQLKPKYKRVLEKFSRKDILTSGFEMVTAAAKAIDSVQAALPPSASGG